MIQNRKVVVNGQEGKIDEFLKQQVSKGCFELTRRGRDGEPTTRHELQLSWTEVEIQAPKYMGKNKRPPIPGTYIRVWEEKENGLEWILFTTMPIERFEQALEKVKWYSMRWIIEEYHKCLKTGCGVEKRNFRSGKALEAVIGMLGIIAAKLQELKYLAKDGYMRQAKDVIPKDLIGIIIRRYKLEEVKLTVKEFWRNVARLGGFIGRKSDGDPGWQTLWKGWVKLLTIQEALDELQKCG